MPLTAHIMPNRSTIPHDAQDPLVCVLAYDGLCAFEYGVALEVFGLPRPEFSRWYEFAVVAAEPGPLRALGGITVTGDGDLDLLERADVVIVPGWRGPEYPVPQRLIAALQVAHERGARLASICSGAFVLAATGLLNGRRATTHWRYAEALAIQHPSVEVVADILYVVNDRVMTSAGSAAGLDLCLHIVRQDFGVDAANAVAHRLVLPAHRDGAQAQILAKPVVHELGGRVAPLLDRMRMSPDEAWPVSRMADVAGFSRRTFVRRFQDATGHTPHAWLGGLRLGPVTTQQSAPARNCEGVRLPERFDLPARDQAGLWPLAVGFEVGTLDNDIGRTKAWASSCLDRRQHSDSRYYGSY